MSHYKSKSQESQSKFFKVGVGSPKVPQDSPFPLKTLHSTYLPVHQPH